MRLSRKALSQSYLFRSFIVCGMLLTTALLLQGKEENSNVKSDLVVTALDPNEVYRGTVVKVTGKGFEPGSTVKVTIGGKELNEPGIVKDNSTFTFAVSDEVPLGRHIVHFNIPKNGKTFPRSFPPTPKDGIFRVQSDANLNIVN
jgi:hypothetical protein